MKCNIIFFESDEDFENFCLAPYGIIVYPDNGSSPYWTGVYSEAYKAAVNEGKKFVIKDENSLVFKHKCVSKRVPIQGIDCEASVQMTVQNLEKYFEEF